MLSILHSKKIFLLSLGLMSCFVLYALFCQMTLYWSGVYNYHDLGLISDFLGNTANQNKYFWVTDLGINHLTLHFTPILFLIAPLYKIFESQLIFPIICVLSVGLSLFLLLFLVKDIFSIYELNENEKSWGYLVCLFVFVTNPYLKSLMLSAHYEAFYLLFAILFLYGLINNFKWPNLILIMLMLLSSRQDTGIFFFFSLLLLVLPAFKKIREKISDFKLKMIISSLFMIFYSLIVIKFVMPAFVQDPAKMSSLVKTFWGQWGDSYSEIFMNIISSPLKVLESAYHGGFWRLNRSFYFLPLLNFPAFVLINFPGFIFYTSNDFYKSQLIFYNSAFLLPGFYLVFILSFKNLLQNKIVVSKKLIAPISVVIIILTLMNFSSTTYGQPSNLKPRSSFYKYDQFKIILNYANQKYHPKSFAASDSSFVFLPNSKIKYLLRNSLSADVIIVEKSDMKLIQSLKENDLLLDERMAESSGFELWVRSNLSH